MLKLIKNPKKRPPPLVTFEKPFSNQKLGVEMLIAMNAYGRPFLTAPQCGIAQRAIAISNGPGKTYFNPTATLLETAPEDSDFAPDDAILCIRYVDYLGNGSTTYVKDNDGTILAAINHLNGIKEKK
jgi:hypothetical protein